CIDDKAISLLDLGVERPRDAMMLRAPIPRPCMRTLPRRARCFKHSGSPVPLSSLWGRWKPPMPQG
ncbi:MAG: hypothetical protein RQ855_04280, partial [Desulfurococcales archaeon]|nr:hypothetical protein [Desulfurococcales archaeon]